MTGIPLGDMLSSPSAKFEQLGQTYRGTVVSADERPQTDITTGAVRTFQDGQTRTQWVITLLQPDGESVALYARRGAYKVASGEGKAMLVAIGEAVKAAGAQALLPGGELAVAFTGLSVAEMGKNPAKLYVAQYKQPVADTGGASLGDLFGDDD